MEQEYLIDTNILIYALKGMFPEQTYKSMNEILRESYNISTITKIELLGWKKIQKNEIRVLNDFLKEANVIFINYKIQEKAVKIRQQSGIETPDSIIAATALTSDMTLVTNVQRDFTKIQDLQTFNPFA